MGYKNFIKSPWTISIGTAICSLLLTMGYDYTKNKPILTTIGAIFLWIWSAIITALNFELKVWWIFIVVIFCILVLYLIAKFKNKEEIKPDFYDYREGKFIRWKWTWRWEWNQLRNAWIVDNLQAHCPKCDTPLIDDSSMYRLRFDCPRCDFRAIDSQCDEPHKIERIILDNIDRQRKEK